MRLSPRSPLAPLYAAALVALALAALLGSPYQPPDGDFWYHLAHGRTLAEERAIPETSTFSFLEPPRQGVNYYWLFQALLYGGYALGGFWLLFAARTAIFVGFLFLLYRYLAREGRAARAPFWTALLFGLATTLAWERLAMLRPHALSNLLLLATLLLLDGPPRRRLALLPLVALVWVNLHGIYYLVLLGVLAIALLDWLRRRRSEPEAKPSPLEPAALLAALAALFATPHGSALFPLAFAPTEFASQYIGEMARPSWASLARLEFDGLTPVAATPITLLLLALLVSLVAQLAARSLSLARLLLAGFGLLLLSRGIRFMPEATLLLLPLLRETGGLLAWRAESRAARWAAAALGALLLAPPLAYAWRQQVPAGGSWPMARGNQPHGVVAFLNQLPATGRVMNHPNHGGYLLWALDRRYPFHMDLEVAFLFTDQDVFEISTAFSNPEGLAAYLARHRPAFVAAGLSERDLPRLMAAHPDYRPLFFDDQAILLGDRRQLGAAIDGLELRWADPYRLAEAPLEQAPAEVRAGLTQELARMAAIAPGVLSIETALARLDLAAGRPAAARERAERILRERPAAGDLWRLIGAAHEAEGNAVQALAAYRRALERSPAEPQRQALWRAIARTERSRGEPLAAWRALTRAVGLFTPQAPLADLVELAALAREAGHRGEAERLLAWARLKLAPGNAVEAERLAREEAALAGPQPAVTASPTGQATPVPPRPQ